MMVCSTTDGQEPFGLRPNGEEYAEWKEIKYLWLIPSRDLKMGFRLKEGKDVKKFG